MKNQSNGKKIMVYQEKLYFLSMYFEAFSLSSFTFQKSLRRGKEMRERK